MSSRIIVAEYLGIKNREFSEDIESIKMELKLALEEAGAIVFDVYGRALGPGVTVVAIIGNQYGEFRGRSHGAVHTYPELSYARLLLDCYSDMEPARAIDRFSNKFQPSQPPLVNELRLALEEL